MARVLSMLYRVRRLRLFSNGQKLQKSKIGHERKQQTMKTNKINYPMGSISSGTMRTEDLIPAFASELERLAKQTSADSGVSAKERKAHLAVVIEIYAAIEHNPTDDDGDGGYYDSDDADYDLESLFYALQAYAAPHFRFGAHPGDGADYGFWLSESWDEDFDTPDRMEQIGCAVRGDVSMSLKVNDISEIPAGFRGEVAVVNDHGNVTLYVKTARTLREVWSIV